MRKIFALMMLLVVFVSPVQASGPMLLPFNTCEEINCNARTVGGSILAFGPLFPYPWTAQFAATRNECLRFDITAVSQLAGLFEMVVITPDGRVFRDSQGGAAACPLCPLVTVPRTRQNGWYTVWVAATGGGLASGVEATFTMQASRYNLNNPNCSEDNSQLTGTPEQEAEAAGRKQRQ